MFDSVEFDNGFLSKLEFEEKKNKINLSNNFCSSNYKLDNMIKKHQEFQENNKILKTSDYYDLSLTVQDISDSMIKNNYQLMIEKKFYNQDAGKAKEKKNICPSPLSPIKGNSFCSYKRHLSFSSTPLRDNSIIKNLSLSSKTNDMQIIEKSKILKQETAEYAYIDADLFEDWNDCEPLNKSIQVSQSINLIEETENEKENECLSNNSIDLLTGEAVQGEKKIKENLFLDSFNFSNLDFFLNENKEDKVLEKYGFCLENKSICRNKNLSSDKKNKSLVAQKLKFGNSCIDSNNLKKPKPEIAYIGFQSDDSFDALINLDLTPNIKENDSKKNINHNNHELTDVSLKLDTNITKDVIESSKNNETINLNDSICFNVRKRRGKLIAIVESDSGEDESFSNSFKQPKFTNTINSILPRKDSEAVFLDLEAEVSDDEDVSSDESLENMDEYEKSFIDENSYFTQNNVESITAKYLESVKCIGNNHGGFKIPERKPYVVEDICSQLSPNKSSNYEFDSFCVKDIEFDDHLSDLEIAEQVLEMDKRKKKRKESKKKRSFDI